MDFRLFGSTFALIFLAELGDKTQLATLALAGSGQARWTVFAAAAAALVLSSAIAVLAGEALARVVPPLWINRAAGAGFIAMGVFLLWSKGSD